MKWKKPIEIPDGMHKGEIVRVIERTDPFEYTDIFIKLEGKDFEMKYGCPSILSKNSKFGRMCLILGAEYKEDEEFDERDFLIGKQVKFMTMMKKSKDGNEYAEIVTDSIKPQVEEQSV